MNDNLPAAGAAAALVTGADTAPAAGILASFLLPINTVQQIFQ